MWFFSFEFYLFFRCFQIDWLSIFIRKSCIQLGEPTKKEPTHTRTRKLQKCKVKRTRFLNAIEPIFSDQKPNAQNEKLWFLFFLSKIILKRHALQYTRKSTRNQRFPFFFTKYFVCGRKSVEFFTKTKIVLFLECLAAAAVVRSLALLVHFASNSKTLHTTSDTHSKQDL